MRFERITLRNFRGVKESVVEFGPGVTVVAGPNEVGKSSIAEAIELVRTTKHSANTNRTRALRPVGRDASPEVELEFTSRGHHVWVRKQWFRGGGTELRISGATNEQHTGDEAHDRLNTLLAEHMDVDLFDALTVTQGESLDQATFVQLRSLTQALDTDGEQGSDHDDLLGKIDAEYELHFSPKTGRPWRRFDELGKEVEELEARLLEAQEQTREMEQFTLEVERANAQLAIDEQDLLDARENLAAAIAKDEALGGLRQAVERAAQQVDLATRSAEQAASALRTRKELIAQVVERGERRAEIRERAGAAEEELAELTTAGEEITRVRDVARESLAEANADAARASQAVERARDHQEFTATSRRLAEAQAAHERRLEAATTIGNTHVDAALLEEIITAAADLSVAEGAQQAAAATLEVEVLGDSDVHLNGEMILGTHRATATQPLIVEAPGLLRVEVRPGALPEDIAQRVRTAQDSLDELLSRGQVESLDAARQAAARRAEAETEHALASQLLDAALGEDTLEELSELKAILQARVGEVEAGEPADLETLRADHDAAVTRVTEAQTALAEAQTNHDAHTEQVADLRERLIRAQSDLESAQDELARVEKSLLEAREVASDEELTDQVTAGEELRAGAQQAHQTAMEALAAGNPEAIEMELANAKDWDESAVVRLEGTKERLAGAKRMVEDRTRRGLYDASVEIEAELAAVKDEYQRRQARAHAAKLLYETVHNRRAATHARYVAPFAERIENLGQIVFGPGFSVEIAPDLSIASRTLDDQTIPFEALSAGAKEQLGLLGRLAAATLVDPVDGAPLILDDTLGFADEGRLNALNAVLNDVGKTSQIIILTCQPRRFSRIGAAEIVHLSPQ